MFAFLKTALEFGQHFIYLEWFHSQNDQARIIEGIFIIGTDHDALSLQTMQLIDRAAGDQDMTGTDESALNQSFCDGHTEVTTSDDADFTDHWLIIIFWCKIIFYIVRYAGF